MKLYLVVGLVILLGISTASAYYTHDLEVQELDKKKSISEEIDTLESQIADAESRITQTEQNIADITPLIQEEQKSLMIMNLLEEIYLKLFKLLFQ